LVSVTSLAMDAIELQQIRSVPLEAVLEGFGAQRDPKDPKHNWRVGDSRITVTGDKFLDHNNERGGGGALDLTLHLMGHDCKDPSGKAFRKAARWLGSSERETQVAAFQVREQALADVPANKEQQAPLPDDSRMGRVRRYLTQERAIPAELVDSAIETGLLFANTRANAVFRLRDETGRDVGFELRGTHEKPFHSVYGEKGLFYAGKEIMPTPARTAAFVESAIEALSYKALNPQALVVSTTGNAIERPERLGKLLLDRGFKIVAAFNADLDGDRFAKRFTERLDGRVTRDRPQHVNDWNLELRAQRASRAADVSQAVAEHTR
jgi:hypothetical protein